MLVVRSVVGWIFDVVFDDILVLLRMNFSLGDSLNFLYIL